MESNDIIKALEWYVSKFKNTGYVYLDVDGTKFVSTQEVLDLITRQQCEIVKQKCIKQLLREDIKTAKSEAYKECLAKVKNYIKNHCNPYGKPDFDYDTSIKILNFIDNLAKEMAGE